MSSAVSDIKTMKIRGANEIALYALKHLRKIAKKEGFGPEFRRASRRLLKARPTAAVLHNALELVEIHPTVYTIDQTIKALYESGDEITRYSKKLFRGKKTVMTHCHSSEVVALLKANRKKIRRVFVTETRPVYQGLITAKELKRAKISVTFIVDSAIGYYMKDIDMVVVGADALRDKLINKIGTCPLAIIASEFGKPVYVVANTFKIDKRKNYTIEMRKPSEIHKPIEGIKTLNPAFDETSYKYISKIVTEKGILTPIELKKKFLTN